jgi:ethylbenzene dioxygenase ferredoxin subunit
MRKIALFDVAELDTDEIRRVDVDGLPPIAVCNLDGRFWALADTCTHGDASMAEGMIEGNNIVCPYHSMGPCSIALKTYPVTVENGTVYLTET